MAQEYERGVVVKSATESSGLKPAILDTQKNPEQLFRLSPNFNAIFHPETGIGGIGAYIENIDTPSTGRAVTAYLPGGMSSMMAFVFDGRVETQAITVGMFSIYLKIAKFDGVSVKQLKISVRINQTTGDIQILDGSGVWHTLATISGLSWDTGVQTIEIVADMMKNRAVKMYYNQKEIEISETITPEALAGTPAALNVVQLIVDASTLGTSPQTFGINKLGFMEL